MKSIRWRISIPYILFAILSLSGLSWYFSVQLQNDYQRTEKEHLIVESHLVAKQVADRYAELKPGELNELAAYYSNLLNARVTFIDPNGKVMGESDSDLNQMENHLNRPEVRSALAGNDASDIRFSKTLLADQLYTAVPIRVDGTVVGIARLSLSLSALTAELHSFQRSLFWITLVIVFIAISFAFLVSENTIRPIRQLTEASKQVGAGRFSSGKILDRKDEIGVLSRALNSMSEKLDNDFKELESEQEKLYAVLTSMSDGVIIIDGEGNVQLMNPAASRMFNVLEHQAIGHSITEILRHYQLINLWKKTRSNGEQQSMTLDLGAEKLHLQVFITPMGGAMQDITLMVIQDLTRQHKLETIRQDFISNVSHELRTPLAAVKSLSETLQEGALEDPPAARRFLSMMDKEIDAMAQIVQELLELSRIESGRAPLQKRETSVLDMLQPAVDRMSLQAVRAGLTLTMEVADGLPLIQADVDRIQQVLMNLLHNAVKFTPPNGKIEVKALENKNFIQVEIHDTGVGIPDSDLPRIFERFYKADRARSGGGTGLGLSVARHIIEAHGGEIWVESRVGEGSTFFFLLPV